MSYLAGSLKKKENNKCCEDVEKLDAHLWLMNTYNVVASVEKVNQNYITSAILF
jgi:hypothetical protein